jgi:hemerythrin-like domain-containing protein
VSENCQISVQVSDNPAFVSEQINSKVVAETTLFVANELFNEALQMMDKHDSSGAKSKLQEAQRYMEAQFNHIEATEALKELYQNIKNYQSQIEHLTTRASKEEFMMFQKMSKMASYSRKRKKP